ncbi:MAG TPA: PilZ domain-containing protein [Sedimentisphaerales bacterium]|nr:PilZ domain-containing protein [Sedimentisphaerales bacterium]
MAAIITLQGAEPREILTAVAEANTPAIVTYLYHNKWRSAKVTLENLGANEIEAVAVPMKHSQALMAEAGMEVGVSVKHNKGKIMFKTQVVDLRQSSKQDSCRTMVLRVPEKIELVQRRNYFRIEVAEAVSVDVLIWHRQPGQSGESGGGRSWQGTLVDISAGGAQIGLKATERPDFRKGQFVQFKFTPLPDETPLELDAQVRNILPTADQKNICIGLQIVALEANSAVLRRLCGAVEQYFQQVNSIKNGNKQEALR